jgi:type II secretory pathway pseudopilin PulG
MSDAPATSSPTSRGPRTNPHPMQRVCHRLRYAARDDRNEDGFTLVEVMVSFGLLVVVAAGAVTGIVSAQRATHVGQQRVQAANVGQQDLAVDLAAYQATGTVPKSTSYTKSLTNEDFRVARTVTFNPSTATACAPGTTFTVHVTVQQKQTGTFLTQTDTVIAC